MEEIFNLIGEVGVPIAMALVMGFFIFMVIKQIFEGIVDSIKTLTMFCESLENRARTMSNEMIKIETNNNMAQRREGRENNKKRKNNCKEKKISATVIVS